MFRINQLLSSAAIVAALALGACSGEADVNIDNDSASVSGGVNADDTAVTINPDVDTAGGIDVDTAGGPDVNLDSAGAAVSGEGIQKLVEAQLMVAPGFSGVDVTSEAHGVIVLNGTVASEEEKTSAETMAKGVAGVKSVKNNLTVKK